MVPKKQRNKSAYSKTPNFNNARDVNSYEIGINDFNMRKKAHENSLNMHQNALSNTYTNFTGGDGPSRGQNRLNK